MQRLGIILLTGLALTGAYGTYSFVLAPVVQLPERSAEPTFAQLSDDAHRPAEHARIAERWLKDHEWAATAECLLRTDEMFVFAEKWTPHGDQGQIRFEPFAGVWLSKNKEGEEEAVTVFAESALLKFHSTFEFDNPQPGRVTGGSLNGDVQITGPDGLEIRGQNFHFVEATRSIFSSGNQSPITFRFGENRGQAGQMTIQLIKSEGAAPKDRPNVVGIETVVLNQNPRMELKLDDDPNAPPIKVNCTGKFEYRVEPRTAIYDENVIAYRKDPKSPVKSDWLRCDRLTVQFEPKETAAVPPRETKGEFQHIERNLQFQSLKAEGKLVRLKSDANELLAVMTSLTYDAKTKTIEMSSRPPTPDSPGLVQVRQKQSQLHCPKIRLVLGEKNSLESAICRGAGWLESYDETTGELAFAADWMLELRKLRDPDTQLDLIELEKEASFRQPSRDTALGAELIRLWFTPPAAGETGDAAPGLVGQSANVQPKRLVATRTVALVSPQFEAEGDQLEVLFQDPLDRSLATHESLGRLEPRAKLQLTSQSGDGGEPAPDAALASVPPEQSQAGNAESKLPTISQIWISGHVRVEQPAKNGGEPLVITGERMHVDTESESRQVVHVYGEEGRPAHIRDARQKLHIEGMTVHLDRAENLAWVEGAGLLQLPVPKTLDGRELSEPQLLDVWWQDRMDFDGLLATFEGDVRATLALTKMRCESMQVALSKRVSFSDETADGGAVDVQTIHCREGVEFENQRYDGDRLMEIQRGQVFEFELNQTTQTTTAQGPGWMKMWQRSNRKRLGSADSVQANRVSTEPNAEWEFTRVDFAGHMAGQIVRRRTSFYDRVQVLYGPVEKPTDVFDRHHLPKGGGWMRCDKLEVAQTPPDSNSKSFVQLLGAGNTHVEGDGFSGRADQIIYDETKDKIVLRSLGQYQSTIWRESGPGTTPEQNNGQQLEFFPATNQVKVVNATSGEGDIKIK